MIYETDTDRVLVWNGSAWYANWNLPWGQLGSVYRTSGSYTVTTSIGDVTGMTVTFTAVANRLYKATWLVNVNKSTSTNYVELTFTDSANTLYAALDATISSNGYANLSGSTIMSGLSAGSKTFKLRAVTGSDTATIYGASFSPCVLLIEDVGPA